MKQVLFVLKTALAPLPELGKLTAPVQMSLKFDAIWRLISWPWRGPHPIPNSRSWVKPLIWLEHRSNFNISGFCQLGIFFTLGKRVSKLAHCTLWLSTQLELSKICKSKGLVFAQFSPKHDNSTFDWWKILKNLLKKYSNQIFAKNVIFIGKKSIAGVWQSGNLAHN